MIDRRLFKGTSMFNLSKQKIQFELNNLKSFIEEISIYINDKKNETEKNYNDALKDLQSENESEIDVDFYFDDEFHKYNEIFPKHHFNPLLLSIYGLFESWLKRLCDLDNRRGFSNIKVNDLAGGNYIEKSRKYLNVVAELNLDETEKIWQKIKQIQKVRNAIAHNNSNIKTDKNREISKQDLFPILSRDKRIVLNENIGSFFIAEKDYLFEVIDLVSKYLEYVIEKLSHRKVVAKNTTMPFNNAGWGQEKSENVIDGIIRCLDLIEEFERRDDEYRESDFKANLKGQFGSVLWDATKLYSFFCDGKWDVNDRELIMNEKKDGFEKLKKIYRR
ncbi:hypothetical protein [Mangrovibacterium diazotrophicum]|uniref:Uncharacterized protein n=1 Tax=Mangrovibacterium diazotrophicum TaxID=1261403 RepID=A0A419W2Z1_9BACT|nr:hypothetical protein [Mangrovibacterium diazotrophicum]RKD89670.1 hypothetical protein BC643_0001 [Mangrovibacterium diazotrophicum]